MQQISSIVGNIIQHKLSSDQLTFITHHDSLTGLMNRAGLVKILEEITSNSKNEMIAIIMIDIDGFSKINDLYGHDIGNMLLKHIAVTFENNFDGPIANLGGDKFIIVAKDLNKVHELATLILNIVSIISAPIKLDDKLLLLTASIGVAIFPNDGINYHSLLKNADIALNQAKSNGGDGVQYFSETMKKEVLRAIKTENDLRAAIIKNEFRLFYQPIVSLSTGDIIGVEALIRWQNPASGLELPDFFISIAEKSDLIVSIGEWVFLEVCRHFPLLDMKMPVAINLSARQFKIKYDIVKFIKILFDKLSLPPKHIGIRSN